MTIIQLTPRQAEMLADRLTQPDCIADALGGWQTDTGYAMGASDSTLEARCRRLELLVLSGRINVSTLDTLDRQILSDAHDGSTWFAMQEAEVDPSDGLAIARLKATVRAVQRKLAAAGLEVDEPVLW